MCSPRPRTCLVHDLLRQVGISSQESETRRQNVRAGWIWVLLLLTLVLPRTAMAESSVFPLLSVGWATPRGVNVGSTYESGPLLGGGVGFRWRPDLTAQVRLDWFKESGRPVAPPFVDDATTELRWVPLTLRLEYAWGQAPDQLLLLAGAGVWFGQEQFTYDLIGVRREASVQSTQPAWSLGAGYVAQRGSLRYRLVGRWMASSGHRHVIRGNTTAETGGRITSSLWTFGLELSPR